MSNLSARVLGFFVVLAATLSATNGFSQAQYYVLDGFGGVHAGGGAAAVVPDTPYFGFGFDVAVDIAFVAQGSAVSVGDSVLVLGLVNKHGRFVMQRFGCRPSSMCVRMMVVAILAWVPALSGQGSPQKVDVTSLSMDANGLIIIVCRGVGELMFADGIYRMGRESEAVFREGRLISVTLRGALQPTRVISDTGREGFVADSFLAVDGKLVMKVEEGERPFPDGEYELQAQADRERGRDRRATSFTVRDGKITEVIIDPVFP